MAAFILRRLLIAVPLLLLTSLIVFAALHLAPGSPETLLVGGRNVDEQTLQSIRDRYHLDDPLIVQYGHWLQGVASGDFGESIRFHDDVWTVVGSRVLPTVELAALALLLILLFGVPLGIVAGARKNSALDTVVSGVTLVGSSISAYLSGILLIAVFSVALGWFPVFGLGGGGADRLYHLILPGTALALSLTALLARTLRASLARALTLEFVETARSRGFSNTRVVGKHALRSALIPVVTITGLLFGYLLSGAVFVEYTFGLNGLGALLVESVQAKDFAVVQAVTLIFTAAFILLSLVVDVLYFLIDPRVRVNVSP